MKESSIKVSLSKTAFKNEQRFAEGKSNTKTSVVSTTNVAEDKFFAAAASLVSSILDELEDSFSMSFTHFTLIIRNCCREITARIWSL